MPLFGCGHGFWICLLPFPLMPLFGCGHGFWICLLLIFLAYIPGIMYDVYAISN